MSEKSLAQLAIEAYWGMPVQGEVPTAWKDAVAAVIAEHERRKATHCQHDEIDGGVCLACHAYCLDAAGQPCKPEEYRAYDSGTAELVAQVGILMAHVAILMAHVERLSEVGHAVVDRWDSPTWADLPHTSVAITKLRLALAATPTASLAKVKAEGIRLVREVKRLHLELFDSKAEAAKATADRQDSDRKVMESDEALIKAKATIEGQRKELKTQAALRSLYEQYYRFAYTAKSQAEGVAAMAMTVMELRRDLAEERAVRLEHEWRNFPGSNWDSCKVCGIVRRADGNNKPCKGPTRLGLRLAAVEAEVGKAEKRTVVEEIGVNK